MPSLHTSVGNVGTHTAVVAVWLMSSCYVGLPQDGSGVDGNSGADGGSSTSADDTSPPEGCVAGRSSAPLRRLTRFEYNNVVRDLLGDDTSPGNSLPSEISGNGFGNDAETQTVSSLLVEQYATVSEGIAKRATESRDKLGALAACAAEIEAGTPTADEETCARELVTRLITRAFRRPVADAEVDELLSLRAAIRESSTFATSIATVIEAVLQSSDFLYRVEVGEVGEDGRRRPTGHEMATRLSLFLWGSIPDDDLLAAAEAGDLVAADGVRAQAERMLQDPRARVVARHFFDNLLPIGSLATLERDATRYPLYTPQIGRLMREETQTLLEREIFENGGTWPGVLTAEHTYMNAELAAYYGVTGVEGEAFQRVDVDTTQRLGMLTHAGVVAGTIHSNETNPVVRGAFLLEKIMCQPTPPPTPDVFDQVDPPNPDSAPTARERFSQHSEDPKCAGCHAVMDPIGFALENYDAVGRWRDHENDVLSNTKVTIPGLGDVSGPVELARKVAQDPRTHACFAVNWANFAYGRTLGADDACVRQDIEEAFAAADHDVAQLLIELTQTEDFLFLPEES